MYLFSSSKQPYDGDNAALSERLKNSQKRLFNMKFTAKLLTREAKKKAKAVKETRKNVRKQWKRENKH